VTSALRPPPANEPPPELARRLAGTPLVTMLDVDGTLAPMAPRPELAVVPPETRRAVAALASRRGVHVALVSGRAAMDARRMVAVANVWVIGNHGAETVSPDGESAVEPKIEPYRQPVARLARRLEQVLAAVPGVVLENKVWSLSVHYRLADPGVLPRLRSLVSDLARQHGLAVTEGKMVLELRAPVRIDKGTAVLHLAQRLGGFTAGASLLFAGDDATDEDAFRALRARTPAAATVRVLDAATERTSAPTAAEFVLDGIEAMRALLQWLADTRR
jgi:trehalose-phosphatase